MKFGDMFLDKYLIINKSDRFREVQKAIIPPSGYMKDGKWCVPIGAVFNNVAEREISDRIYDFLNYKEFPQGVQEYIYVMSEKDLDLSSLVPMVAGFDNKKILRVKNLETLFMPIQRYDAAAERYWNERMWPHHHEPFESEYPPGHLYFPSEIHYRIFDLDEIYSRKEMESQFRYYANESDKIVVQLTKEPPVAIIGVNKPYHTNGVLAGIIGYASEGIPLDDIVVMNSSGKKLNLETINTFSFD